MTHAAASSVKAWTTLRARETVALAREILGGNGIVTDFHVAKAFCDLEALYSYEGITLPMQNLQPTRVGTYDINCLVSGREITGLSAIKPRK